MLTRDMYMAMAIETRVNQSENHRYHHCTHSMCMLPSSAQVARKLFKAIHKYSKKLFLKVPYWTSFCTSIVVRWERALERDRQGQCQVISGSQ